MAETLEEKLPGSERGSVGRSCGLPPPSKSSWEPRDLGSSRKERTWKRKRAPTCAKLEKRERRKEGE